MEDGQDIQQLGRALHRSKFLTHDCGDVLRGFYQVNHHPDLMYTFIHSEHMGNPLCRPPDLASVLHEELYQHPSWLSARRFLQHEQTKIYEFRCYGISVGSCTYDRI